MRNLSNYLKYVTPLLTVRDTKKALSTIMSATTNQCFHTNAVMDEYITELAACLMQKPNVLM